MKPIRFKQANKVLQKPDELTDEQCDPLPVLTDGTICVSCWQPTIKERFSILFCGRVWLIAYSGSSQPPVALLGEKTILKGE